MADSTLTIPEDLMQQIEAIAARTDRTVIEVIRDAMRILYKESSGFTRWPSSFGMAAGGSFDASKDEEYLAEHWARHIEGTWSHRRPSGDSSD